MQLTKVIAVFVVLAVLVAGCTSPSQGPTSTPSTSSSPVAGVSPSGTQVAVAPAPAASPTAAVEPTATPQPTVTATPSPTATPTQAPSTSLLEGKTWLTLYGRGWEIAPILGRLGSYKGTADMAAEIGPWMDEMKKHNGGKEVVPVLHLIYAMAIPCEPDNHCLLYLDTAGEEIVEDYIKPAAERGWQVILDSQVGSSNPVEQVQRMIDRGYLDYPNVHVALDPEFHVYPGEDLPGIPIGQLAAADLNDAQQLVNDLVQAKGLPKKVFMVHQFGDPMVDDGNPFMITEKKTVKALPNIEFVIDADGFGAPGIKTKKYNLMTDPEDYPFVKYRAIKLFFYNPYEEAHHADTPVMTWPQVFGTEDAAEGIRMEWKPDIIVVA